jgi:hypothetical protein
LPAAVASDSVCSSVAASLQQAIEDRDVDAVARILEAGAQFDVEFRNSRRQTVLHLMATAGRAALCRLVRHKYKRKKRTVL